MSLDINPKTKAELIAALSDIHDKIKNHPFREDFSGKYLADYKYLLDKLSDIWANYIYNGSDRTPDALRLYYQFAYWIHDYRATLKPHRRDSFPMMYFDYFERMLQVTHEFIQTGELTHFYAIDALLDARRDTQIRRVEHYRIVTRDECGIDSIILPQFMPVNYTIETDPDWIRNTVWYRKYSADEFVTKWTEQALPVIEYLNAQHKPTELKHPTLTFRSHIESELKK